MKKNNTAAIKKAQAKRAELRESGQLEIKEHNLILKYKRNPKSRKLAIYANCFECMGGTEADMPDPGWKEAIRDCTSAECNLFQFRPYV